MMYLTYILCWMIGVFCGMCLMFQVSKAMVRKVREQEDDRLREMMETMQTSADHWMDVVIDIQTEIRQGRLQGKSIKDQDAIIRNCIKGKTEECEVEILGGADSGEA